MPPLRRIHTVSIVGAGRVGTALGRLLARAGVRIVSVVSRRTHSARRLARSVRCPVGSRDVRDLSPATEVLLLTVPDHALRSVAEDIAAHAPLPFRTLVVFHTSGTFDSSVLAPLRRRGSSAGSLHPISSFPERKFSGDPRIPLRGIFYGYEGPPGALRTARSLARKLGGELLVIPKKEKIPYHIACVFASNYLLLLLSIAGDVMAGMRSPRFRSALIRLARISLRNAQQRSPSRSLTGPLVRKDIGIIRTHMEFLDRTDKEIAGLYRVLGTALLRRVEHAGSSNVPELRRLRRILGNR